MIVKISDMIFLQILGIACLISIIGILIDVSISQKKEFESGVVAIAMIILPLLITFGFVHLRIPNFEFERNKLNIEEIEIHSNDYYKVTVDFEIDNNTNFCSIKKYKTNSQGEILKPIMYQKNNKVEPKIITNDLEELKKAKNKLYFGKETRGAKRINQNGKEKLYVIFPKENQSELIKINFNENSKIIYDNEKEKIKHKKGWENYQSFW